MAISDAASVETSGNKPIALSDIDIPAEQPLLHSAIKIREQLDDGLASAGLLGITRGEDSLKTAALVDYLTAEPSE